MMASVPKKDITVPKCLNTTAINVLPATIPYVNALNFQMLTSTLEQPNTMKLTDSRPVRHSPYLVRGFLYGLMYEMNGVDLTYKGAATKGNSK